MSHHRVLRLLAVLLGALGVAALAAPFTGVFEALIAELDVRAADGELAGRPAQAVRKASRKLAKASDSVARDLKTLQSLAKPLERAFPDEFADPLPEPPALGPLVLGAADDLETLVRGTRDTLASSVALLSERGARKAQRAIDGADRYLDRIDPAGATKRRAVLLFRAQRKLDQAEKIVTKDPGVDPGDFEGTRFVADGRVFRSSLEANLYDVAKQTLHLSATEADGDRDAKFSVSIVGVTGPGTYGFPGAPGFINMYRYRDTSQPGFVWRAYEILPGSGSLVVTVLDLATPRLEATFTFVARDLDGNEVTLESGVVSTTDLIVDGP